MSEEEEDRPFKVKDRRRFDAEGNQRDEAEEAAQPAEAGGPDVAPGGPDVAPGGPDVAPGGMPTIDFATFVISLSTSVMMHLGEAPHPDGSTKADLALARQTIDILGMLRDKTAGNLTPDEDGLLRELLYDLRLRFVNARG